MTGMAHETDYYEVLEISRRADMDAVHRVFRMMAARFHPDNPESGDAGRFDRLRRAYDVLSNVVLREQYDVDLETRGDQPLPIFRKKEFVTGVEAEMNRRLGILSLLYIRRRTSEFDPGMSLLEFEKLMAFPREHLKFTLWYLLSKGCVQREENTDYSLTAEGVDYVEARASSNRIVRELLAGRAARTVEAFAGGEAPADDLALDEVNRSASAA